MDGDTFQFKIINYGFLCKKFIKEKLHQVHFPIFYFILIFVTISSLIIVKAAVSLNFLACLLKICLPNEIAWVVAKCIWKPYYNLTYCRRVDLSEKWWIFKKFFWQTQLHPYSHYYFGRTNARAGRVFTPGRSGSAWLRVFAWLCENYADKKKLFFWIDRWSFHILWNLKFISIVFCHKLMLWF